MEAQRLLGMSQVLQQLLGGCLTPGCQARVEAAANDAWDGGDGWRTVEVQGRRECERSC
jgi:hypothetical protein